MSLGKSVLLEKKRIYSEIESAPNVIYKSPRMSGGTQRVIEFNIDTNKPFIDTLEAAVKSVILTEYTLSNREYYLTKKFRNNLDRIFKIARYLGRTDPESFYLDFEVYYKKLIGYGDYILQEILENVMSAYLGKERAEQIQDDWFYNMRKHFKRREVFQQIKGMRFK